MRRRQFIGLFVAAALCVAGCGKPLSERVVGTWQFYEDGKPRADGLEITLSPEGEGQLSAGEGFKWQQYPNMQYVTLSFEDGGAMTIKLVSDDEATLDMAGEMRTLRRKK